MAIAASFVGTELNDTVGAVIIVAMKDGSVGLAGTGQCECGTLQILSRAIERVADGLHAGEEP